IMKARIRVVSATGFVEQIAIVSAILKLRVPGTIVECGTYQGASAIAISLACALTGRRLYVFDSFEGLPEPTISDRDHAIVRDLQIATYEKGAWCGPLELVRNNIRKYGALSVCSFVQGYFDTTLTTFHEPVALAFCDVDLLESLRTCLRYLWPLMSEGGMLFTHEAHHHEIAALFYDQHWWQGTGFEPPGLIGAGNGLGLSLQADGSLGSCLGYAIKNPRASKQSLELGKHETRYLESDQHLIRQRGA
ncbi:MAG: TylF/MycF/NovP-related O-methyltransferase, partial [Candidatus Sulfotelmatobacter sp.]